jgi:CsoR family transcriptional regulator, copper-sensing transcriptional repressor
MKEKRAARAARDGRGLEAQVGNTANPPVDTTPRAHCACDARKATGIDPAIKDRNLKRLRRIEGQVRGLQKMVEDERYCADVLTQLSSVHEALRGVAREVMRNHLKHCATSAIRTGDDSAEQMYDELLELMYTHAR